MRNPVVSFILLSLALNAVSFAQNSQPTDERAAVTTAARNYMDAYYTADASRMDQVLHPQFHKRTLRLAGGQLQVKEDTRRSLLEGVNSGTGKNIPANRRVQKIEVLDVYKNGANVKVVTGGWVDYMLLSKTNGEWRVLDVVLQYTNR